MWCCFWSHDEIMERQWWWCSFSCSRRPEIEGIMAWHHLAGSQSLKKAQERLLVKMPYCRGDPSSTGWPPRMQQFIVWPAWAWRSCVYCASPSEPRRSSQNMTLKHYNVGLQFSFDCDCILALSFWNKIFNLFLILQEPIIMRPLRNLEF